MKNNIIAITKLESFIIWQIREAISAVLGSTTVLIRNNLTRHNDAHCFTPSAVSLKYKDKKVKVCWKTKTVFIHINEVIPKKICFHSCLSRPTCFITKRFFQSKKNVAWSLSSCAWMSDGSAESFTNGRAFNPFQSSVALLYPLKTSENLKVFWCFQGVKQCNTGLKWVNLWYLSVNGSEWEFTFPDPLVFRQWTQSLLFAKKYLN